MVYQRQFSTEFNAIVEEGEETGSDSSQYRGKGADDQKTA